MKVVYITPLKDGDTLYEPLKVFNPIIAREKGLVYAELQAMKRNEADYYVVFDADGSHRVFDIIRLTAKAIYDKNDLTIGSRYMKGAFTHDSAVRRTLSKAYNSVFWRGKDATSGLRVYSKRARDFLITQKIAPDWYGQVEIYRLLYLNGYKISFYPIRFLPRQIGKSNFTIKDFLKYGLRILTLKSA